MKVLVSEAVKTKFCFSKEEVRIKETLCNCHINYMYFISLQMISTQSSETSFIRRNMKSQSGNIQGGEIKENGEMGPLNMPAASYLT